MLGFGIVTKERMMNLRLEVPDITLRQVAELVQGFVRGKTFLELVLDGTVDFKQCLGLQFDLWDAMIDSCLGTEIAQKYGIPYEDYWRIFPSSPKIRRYFIAKRRRKNFDSGKGQ
jgi:hypothetical protein